MRRVKGVVGKIINLLINILGCLFWDPIVDTAADTAFRIAVQKRLFFPLDLSCLFFGNGPANHVRLPQGIAGQFPKNFNDLLLINDAAVGVA